MIGLLPCHSIFVEVDDIKRKTELLHHEGMNLGLPFAQHGIIKIEFSFNNFSPRLNLFLYKE